MAEATPPTADPNARAQLGRTSIPGASPAGEQANDAPEFEQLREEATKDPVQGPPAWETVARLGEGILREKSKDFVVASYTGVALAHTDGLAGLHDALRLLDGLMRSYWDEGFPPVPKRLRARANALTWFAEKAGAWLERAELKPGDAEKLEGCLEAANALSEAVAEKFDGGEVGLGPILSVLRESSKRLAAETPTAAPRAASPSSPAAAAAPSAPSAPVSGEIATRDEAIRLVRHVARFLRGQSAASPEAFAVPRVLAWSEVQQAPPVQDDGRTLIPAPESRQAVEAAAAGPPDALLAAVESAFDGAPLWLDLQRHAVQAMEQLGGPYQLARGLVLALTRDLVERVPALPSLHFADGSPLADELTRQWISELGGAEGAAAASSAASTVDPVALADLRRECQPLVKKGRLAEVQQRLATLFAEDRSPRARFHERLELATLCFEGGRDRVALALLDGLEADIAAHELERWDPELAARVLQALYRAHLKALGKAATPEQVARREEIFARLCRLEPAQAAALE